MAKADPEPQSDDEGEADRHVSVGAAVASVVQVVVDEILVPYIRRKLDARKARKDVENDDDRNE